MECPTELGGKGALPGGSLGAGLRTLIFNGCIEGDKSVRKPVIVLMALLLAICVMACTPAPKPQEFKSEAGRFSVMAPVVLKETTQTQETAAGKVVCHLYLGNLGGLGYGVAYSDYPEEGVRKSDPEKILDGGRNGAVSNVNGKLVIETKIALEGNPGRELVIDAKDASQGDLTIKARLFLVGNRLYVVMAAAKKGQVGFKEMDQFLQSFKLLGK